MAVMKRFNLGGIGTLTLQYLSTRVLLSPSAACLILNSVRNYVRGLRANTRVLNELRRPIEKDVFMRMLSYYEFRSQIERPSGASTKMNAAQPAAALHRRKP